jgi:hypothetical protein
VELAAAWGDLGFHMSVRKRALNGASATINGTQINLAASAVANGVQLLVIEGNSAPIIRI